MAGLYVHIPFCESRCIYCGFYSTTRLGEREAYVDALCRELELRRNYLEGAPLSTVYLGGGTPSMLTASQLQRLFEKIRQVFTVDADAEITMECNPDDVTADFCRALEQLPVNRISMGAQTFSDERLAFLHRRHRAQQVSTAVQLLRAAGIRNISIDLMFGFPGQTLTEWADDVEKAISLNVEHLSAYSLMIEEGTPLHRLLQCGEIEEIDEELYRSMFNLLADRLAEAGYEHYEISNFAREHCRSRHNSSYWTAQPYLGIGAAAHSFNRLTRSWNVASISKYVSAIRCGQLPQEQETITPTTRYNDLVVTALRTREGINLTELSSSQAAHALGQAQPFLQSGELRLTANRLSLTRSGIFISNTIMSELLLD